MTEEEKELLIKKDIASIENRVRHAFNQGYEMGLKERKNTCKDTISRQEVLDYIYNDLGLGDEENGKDVERQMELESSYIYIKSLSPVNPQPKTGHWIDSSNGWMCSECNKDNTFDTNYCPNCGAKMVEPQESKEKETEEEKERKNTCKDRCIYCAVMFDEFCAKAKKDVTREEMFKPPYKPDWCPGRVPLDEYHDQDQDKENKE